MQRSTVFKVLEKFSYEYNSAIEGSTKNIKKHELDCAARICYFLHQRLEKNLSEIEVKEKKGEKEILTTIKNIQVTLKHF